ncbi:hypothetical protein PR003_g13814 [Phytophthora rubi]|uniref:Translin-associated factor X-interacting protein 1 N-terminal domain-containing protein n=1 Tax=Phytophthora rubi TaxID=129364 RepID=A0A6A4FG72_9STRA|nr:hypothetical protein PR002_g16030 [Phytophthora rubi]KAE9012829.1 hypothetical protein PR001_g15564 [Phytophthora rubi]KAE9333861.1 hypothetical protein PR003_g13814 [Phytophthora rubi]
MDFVAVGLASPPPRRPKGNASTSSSLPPLTNDLVQSPRRNVNELVPRSPSNFHLDKPPHRHQPRAAEVASWPLTFAPGSPNRRGQTESTVDLDPFSPISPKVRKLHTRTRLVDDSRTRPALLQELLCFLHAELDGDERETSTPAKASPPSLRRLQIVREALNRLIDGFNVYAPVLMRIRDEYEHAVEALYARSLMVPGLNTRLQSVETHCLRQISASSAEAKARLLTLKRRLAETQAMLAASAAESARLNAALRAEKDKVVQAEKKLAEAQRSTLALASSVRRHDESLRAGHERSLEDARALQKVTARYYHACDELAELKKTVAALEEQGNGEHVAADKNTIVLLSRELQELSTALTTASGPPASTSSHQSSQDKEESKHLALNHAFVAGLDGFGLELELSELLAGITSAPTIPEGVSATAAMITQQLTQVQQRQFALLAAKRQADGDTQSPLVFLTEPAELLALNDSTAEKLVAAHGEFLPGRGMGPDVPSYLQHDGFVRNLHLPRVRIEQLLAQVWDQFDEQLRVAQHRHSSTRASFSSSVDGTKAALVSASGSSLLTMALERFLQRSRDNRADRVELVYNFLAGLEQFSSQSSTCRLFHLVFNQELPVEARVDQTRELARLHEALAVVDHDRHFSNTSSDSSDSVLSPGRVLLADVVRTLRLMFPWKSDAALSQLHRALLVDLRGHPQVDYAALLAHHPHVSTSQSSKTTGHRPGQPQVKCQFAECLKMQRLDDLLTFRQHVQRHIRRKVQPNSSESEVSEPLGGDAGALMVSLHDLRACLHAADASMPEQDMTKILAAVSGLSARELLTHDDMMLDACQVLQRLPTLLLRPTGRFTGETTSP